MRPDTILVTGPSGRPVVSWVHETAEETISLLNMFGYSATRRSGGKIVTAYRTIRPGDTVTIKLNGFLE